GQSFALHADGPLGQYREARALGIETRPVIVGPVTWLSLAKAKDAGLEPFDLLEAVLPVYAELLARLAEEGAQWVQVDEPVLALDLSERQRQAFARAYEVLGGADPKLLVATYFGALGDNAGLAASLPV